MVKVRLIEERDNQAVGKLVQVALEEAGLNLPGTAYFDPHLFALYSHYQTEDRNYWVVEKEGIVIGGAGIGPFSEGSKVGELQKLYIDKAEQGKGYAHLLMEKVMDFAEGHYDACYIETFGSLSKANGLYRKYGFEELSEPLSGSEHSACDAWLLKKFK